MAVVASAPNTLATPQGADANLGVALPPLLAAAADLGVLLSLALVLIGWGPVGTAAGVLLGAVSVAGVITGVVQGAAKRVSVPPLRPAEPAYALVRRER